MTTIRLRITGLVAVALVAVAACGGSSEGAQDVPSDAPTSVTAMARPASLADLMTVELVGPPPMNAGRAPIFEWKGVANAVTYRLTVLAPAGPSWSWQGAGTSIRYGGVEEGVNGPSLVAGSYWSVAALAADGSALALSDLRAVSPANDAGPSPSWTKAAPATPAPVEETETDAPTDLTACDLLTPEEIEDKLGRAVKPGKPSDMDPVHRCGFYLLDGLPGLTVDINPRTSYIPEKWAGGAYEPLEGLGEDSFAVKSGILKVAGFIRGERSVTLTLSFGKKELLTQLAELAKVVDRKLVALD